MTILLRCAYFIFSALRPAWQEEMQLSPPERPLDAYFLLPELSSCKRLSKDFSSCLSPVRGEYPFSVFFSETLPPPLRL